MLVSISALQDLDFTKVKKLFIPNNKKETRKTSKIEDTASNSNFNIAMPRIEGNNTAYYFEIKDEVCVCACGVCKAIWHDKVKYVEKWRADN
jgi:hypothetical protein